MPSVTDVQQPTLTSNISGKSTPPPPSATSADITNADPLVQALQVLEKKQRNLGKRKEKLEVYQQEEKTGKQLHKDQKEALAKYPEVLGQIECVKELMEQFKKIQTESSKNQKRLTKQAAEDKRQLVSQRLREYTQLRYLLDHRPTSLTPEQSTLLDQLASAVIPTDNSSNSISRSVDFVSSIYQGGQASSTIKTLTGKSAQEVRDLLEELMKNPETPSSAPLPPPPEPEQVKELNPPNDIQSSERNFIEHPLRFDTREQNIPLEQIIQDSPFLPDLNNPNQDQLNDPEQYLPTFTVVNSNINEQSSSVIDNQQKDNSRNDEHQTDEQWQHQRGNGNARGQFNNENRNYNRGTNNYNQQSRRGPRGGWYDNSYGGNQRPYNETNRGRGGSNPNYRGNRGGNYRGGNRAYYNNANGYQKSAHYQQTNEQYHQVRSAPPSGQQ